MNSSTKLLSGIALIMSLTAYVSAGAMDDLKGNVPEVKLELPSPAAEAVPAAPQKVAFQYLTSVNVNYISDIVRDFFFMDDKVMFVGVALNSVVQLPPNPIAPDLYALNGFTVMASGSASEISDLSWPIVNEYNVAGIELATAVNSLVKTEDMAGTLLEITKGTDKTFTIKVKKSPWKHGRFIRRPNIHWNLHSLQL